MFNKYYEQELHKLREQAIEFAKEHPVTAPLLMGPSMDPGAERLLEGVAYLSGLLHHKMDSEFHRFIKEVIEVVYPHILRPIPSTSIVIFEPKTAQSNPTWVKSGTMLNSIKIEDNYCQFQTTFGLEVNPVKLINARAEQISEDLTQIEINLEYSGNDLNRWQPNHGLYFFLGGTYTRSTNIFMLLNHYLDKIIIKADNGSSYQLSKDKLQPIGLHLANKLLEFPNQSFAAFRLLQEYFILPQKFTFMQLSGIQEWVNRGSGNRFTLYFILKNIPEEMPVINRDSFIFNAVPVINLFDYEMEPIHLNHNHEKTLLRPNSEHPNHYQVYDVKQVIGYKPGAIEQKTYQPLSSFHGLNNSSPVYQVIRERSIVNNQPQVSLFFPYQEKFSNLSEETLAITLRCTNGRLPEKLRVGDICRPSFDSPQFLNFRNILQPTLTLEPPSDSNNLWRFVAYLSLNFLSLTKLENFKALLRLYLYGEDQDKPRLIANQKRINGISAMRSTAIDRIHRGKIMRGQQITMEVKADQFAGIGDVYLFGSIINQFVNSYSSMNTFTQFNLKEINSGIEFKWPATIGNRVLS